MEPISAIALSLALGAGATAGKELVSEAVKDTYEKLKELIQARYPKASAAAVQERPESKHRRSELEEDLAAAGAAEDFELAELANKLIESVREKAPDAARVIAVELKDVEAASLALRRIRSSGGAVKIVGGRFSGDLDFSDIESGIEIAPSRDGSAQPSSAYALSRSHETVPPAIQLQIPYVGGSVSISNVQVAIYQKQIRHLKKVRWRELEHVSYAVVTDSGPARQKFVGDICEALRDAFGVRYERFTVILASQVRQVDDDTIFIYAIESPRAKFAAVLRERQIKFVEAAITMNDGDEATVAARRLAIAEMGRKQEESWAGWKFKTAIEFSSEPSALEIIYDPETRCIKLQSADTYSLDPADYPDHLKTTSELLKFVAGSHRTHIGFIGDTSWQANDFRLLKVIMQLLDNESVDLSAIRINVDDPEEWDYSNPVFESEIGARLGSKS
jgi:hypothetical protein